MKYSNLKEIDIKDIAGFRLGNCTDAENGTGVTVILCEQGAMAGADIRGGGPAARESLQFMPGTAPNGLHGLVLAGGSTFGLDAAGGVQRYLEEKGIGIRFAGVTVPLVAQFDIFDLLCGNADVRPTVQMGYDACLAAERGDYEDGCFGGGTGATVGKVLGAARATKTGIGSYAVRLGALQLGAVVIVNALGHVVDRSGKILAGVINDTGDGFVDADEAFLASYAGAMGPQLTGNTTIGAILTNANFDRNSMTKLAALAQNGLVRAISPVNTYYDGDAIAALTVGGVEADVNIVGTLAAQVMQRAIEKAVTAATSGYGYRAAREVLKA